MCVLSLSRCFSVCVCAKGSEQTKNLPGKSLCLFGTFRRDTEFQVRVSILFLTVFRVREGCSVELLRNELTTAWDVEHLNAWVFAVFVGDPVPVASGANGTL